MCVSGLEAASQVFSLKTSTNRHASMPPKGVKISSVHKTVYSIKCDVFIEQGPTLVISGLKQELSAHPCLYFQMFWIFLIYQDESISVSLFKQIMKIRSSLLQQYYNIVMPLITIYGFQSHVFDINI